MDIKNTRLSLRSFTFGWEKKWFLGSGWQKPEIEGWYIEEDAPSVGKKGAAKVESFLRMAIIMGLKFKDSPYALLREESK